MAEPNKDEQIGYHKGSLATLAKERAELLKMVNVVEQLKTMHIKALKDHGIDLEQEAKKTENKPKQNNKSKKDVWG